MADTTILSGDVGVTWFDNNRNRRLEWIGGTNTNYTMNQIYSAMQTLQDETATIDNPSCFTAETPTEYTTGIRDQGSNDPWYVSYELMEKVTAGALQTASWARVTSSNTGIVCVTVTAAANTIVKADEGFDISNGTTSDAGTLLEVLSDGGTYDYLMIRPDSSAAANDFDGTVGTLTCNANTATTIFAGATTGEQVWPNIYSIGTIEPSVHQFLYQGEAKTVDSRARKFSWNDNTLDWYGNGHIDTTIALNDFTQAGWPTIDGGFINVFARKGGDFQASFEVANNTTSGGRNPIPLGTSVDADQSHGTKVVSFVGAVTGTYTDGEIITGVGGGRGILDLTNSTVTSGGELVYFPIATDAVGGALTVIGSSEVVTGADSGATCTTNGAPADDGAALLAWFTAAGGTAKPTITIGNALADINNDTTNEFYSMTIDCNQNRLSAVYQWVKFIAQYGQGDTDAIEQAFTDDLAQANVFGEEFIGGTASITYVAGTTPTNIAEGESVTQQTSLATGVVISHDTTNKKILLRSTRGTFDTNTIDADDDGSTLTTVTASNFSAKTTSPLGTFAGGNFFGARGVLLTDYHADDTNLFTLTDIDGGTYQRPTSLTFAITNLVGSTAITTDVDDRVSFFQLTGAGGNIQKDMFGGLTGTLTEGQGTMTVANTIEFIPDSGSLVIAKDAGSATAEEFKIRYASHSGASSVFTFANIAGFVTTGTNTATQVTYATGGFNAMKRGDFVWNETLNLGGYIKTIDSDTQITLEGAGIAGNTVGNTVGINTLPVGLDTADDMYVPYIDKIAETSSESAAFIDPEVAIYYRVKARNSRATIKIKPFSSDGNVTSANASVQITRTPDTIIT
tara:strand:+ start:10377 stop:12935 length:2559 start_codon:yes stop_codon:yes gene_type:complete